MPEPVLIWPTAGGVGARFVRRVHIRPVDGNPTLGRDPRTSHSAPSWLSEPQRRAVAPLASWDWSEQLRAAARLFSERASR